MSVVTSKLGPVQEALAKRCAALKLPVWLCDAAGAVVAPAARLPADLDASQVAVRIAQLAGASARMPADPVELCGAWRMLLLEEKHGSRRVSITAVLLPQSDSIHQIAGMLRWNFEDLMRSRRDQTTIQQFSQQLAQSYEENNVLLGLSRALNRVSQPSDLVQKICDQLIETLPFGWVAIRFRAMNKAVRDLAGKMFIAGNPPCERAALERECAVMVQTALEPGFEKLQNPGMTPLSTLVNSEVIAEPVMHDDELIAILTAGNKYGEDPGVKSGETQFFAAAAGFLGIFHENIARFVEHEAQFLGTLRALTASIDAKDHYTRGHSERVAHLSWLMAQAMKLSPGQVEDFRIAGMVHDVGKIGVPESILCKPGRPTDEEFAKIRRHPQIGHEILKDIPRFEKALPAVLHHHERWDGRGYPFGIAGEKIPLVARVMALADAFDAMSSTRSYRPALSRDKVLTEMLHCAGGQFDPDLAPLFVRLDFTGFDGLVTKHSASEKFAA